MKLDGIPDNVIVSHTHDVVIKARLQVDDETTRNVKDIAVTIVGALTIGYTVKQLVILGSRLAMEYGYKRI